MANEQLQEYADWRAIQKERERERRRMRDRQRRQSMTLEEREKHLARRRRNYQLRRQRAANAQSGFQQQVNVSTETAAEPSIRNDSLELVCSSEPSEQSDPTMQFGPSEANQGKNASAVNYGQTILPGLYKYPRLLRLTQIKHLARLLNSSADKPFVGSQEMGANTIDGEIATPKGIRSRGIRLIHLKHLVRVLHSKMGTNYEQNDSQKIQGGENDFMQRKIETTIVGALLNRQSIDTIDEDEQICPESTCNF